MKYRFKKTMIVFCSFTNVLHISGGGVLYGEKNMKMLK
jgi:hypothetical protein